MFKIGIKTKNITKHIIETLFQGKKSPTVIVIPYGMFSNPVDNLPVGILSDQGHAESLFGFVMDLENLETLEDGEIAFGIPKKTARIKFFDNDKIGIYNKLISMLEILEGLIDEIKTITTTGSAVAQAVSVASQASLELYKLEVEKLLNGS